MRKVFCSMLCFTILLVNCDSDKNRWEKTKASNTIQSYTEFINKYPDSKFYQSAIYAIDSINYHKTDSIGTLAAYKKFIDDFPGSKFYELANNVIDSINYYKTDSISTQAAYKKFINDFPNSRYIKSIKGKFRKVSFTLFHYQAPFANEEIAVFPVVNDRVVPDELGFGKTDSKGNITIEFFNPQGYTEFILIGRLIGSYMLLRHNGSALTFMCDAANFPCDLGKLVFETFEISSPL